MEINARSNLVEAMWQEWCMIECLRAGTTGMRFGAQTYLPKWPLEDPESYTFRLNTSFLFNGFEQTVESLTGRPFCEPLKLNDNIPPNIAANLEDVDLEGRNLHTFARDLFRVGVAKGHAYILVDFPTTTGAATQADLQVTNARPYMQAIDPQQILYWQAERINGVMTLTEVRIWELTESQAGLFGNLEVEQVRVLKQDVFEVWRPQLTSDNKTKEWAMEESGPNTLGIIPLVPFYALRTGFMTSRPPLLDLAYLNVEHWQSASDQRSILHTARVPLLTIKTDDEAFQLAVGGKYAVRIPIGGDLKWTEIQGGSIEAGRQDLLDLEDRMRQLGAELIIVQSGGRMSATAAQILDNKSESKLGAMAQGLEDAINTALYVWAQWIGEPEGGTVEVYKDFGIDAATAADETLLLTATQAGKISDETFFSELQRRGTINSDLKWDEEQERIEAQGPAIGTLGEPDPFGGTGNQGQP